MRRFRLNILVRVLLLAFTLAGFIYLLTQTVIIALTIFAGIIALIQVILLVRYVEQTNRLLEGFFNSIKYDDFTATQMLASRGRSFEALNQSLDQVMEQFRQVRLEKETTFRYLEQVIHHLSVPTISVKKPEGAQSDEPGRQAVI